MLKQFRGLRKNTVTSIFFIIISSSVFGQADTTASRSGETKRAETTYLALWGTDYHGPNGCTSFYPCFGSIFQLCNTGGVWSYNDMYDFQTTGNDASAAEAGFYVAADGNFYSMSDAGGVNGLGAIFKYNPTTFTYSRLYDFSSALGSYGESNYFIQVPGGGTILYGMTYEGGANNEGTLFTFNYSTNTYTKIHDFGANASDGQYPQYNNLFYYATNGLIHGLANGGGTNGDGALFSLNTGTNVVTTLYSFNTGVGGGGCYPYGGVVEATNKLGHPALFGVNGSGGANFWGSIFE